MRIPGSSYFVLRVKFDNKKIEPVDPISRAKPSKKKKDIRTFHSNLSQ